MRSHLCPPLIVLALITVNCSAQAHKRAAPPTGDQVAGTWIGFDDSGREFIRLELQRNGSGYIAMITPANFLGHDYGAQVYRVIKWSIEGWRITCNLSPVSSNAEPAQANGQFFVSSLHLGIHGAKRRWKIDSVLYMESQLDGSNEDTKNAILSVQNK